MAPISSGAQKMNLFLQQRRKKINKDKNFRKQRILKHYHKAQQSYEKELSSKLQTNNNDETQNKIGQSNPEIERKINFYNQVFNEPHINERLTKNKNKKKKNKSKQHHQNQVPQKNEKAVVQEKLDKLKEKKVKFIKKMQVQKTSKGQPVMRNMIKYALTKIEQNIHKEKLQKLVMDEKDKKQKSKKGDNHTNHRANK